MLLLLVAIGPCWAVAPNVAVDQLTTNDTTPVLTGTWQSGDGLLEGIIAITVQVDGGLPIVGALLGGTSGTWSASVPTALADGVHEVTATATLLNTSSISDGSSDELTIDTRAIAITVTPLATTDTTPLITGTLDDPGGVVDAVEIEVAGVSYVDYAPGATSWAIQLPDPLAVDRYDVLALALDNGGTTVATDSSSDELVIDGSPVSVTVTELQTDESSPTLQGTYSAGVGVAASVRITVDGASYLDSSPAGGVWSAAVTATLADGTYDVLAEVLDGSGTVLAQDATVDELRTGADVGIDLLAPVGAVTFYQADPAEDSAPVFIATSVAVSTSAATHFNGGLLRATMSAGSDPGDVLALVGGDGVAVDTAGEVTVDGVVIGTIRSAADGIGGDDLVVDLVADGGSGTGANPTTMARVIQRLSFANIDGAHPDAVRALQVEIEDGLGGSGSASRNVELVAVDNLPVIETVSELLTAQDLPVSVDLVASDPDSAELSYAVDAGAAPTLGSLLFDGVASLTTVDSPVSLTYRPVAGASGDDSFRVAVSDATGTAISSSDDGLPGVATAVRITPFDDPAGDPAAVRPKVVSDPPMWTCTDDALAHPILIDADSVDAPGQLSFRLEGAPAGVALVADPFAAAGPTATVTWAVPSDAGGCYGFGIRIVNLGNRTVTWLPIMLVVEDRPGGSG